MNINVLVNMETIYSAYATVYKSATIIHISESEERLLYWLKCKHPALLTWHKYKKDRFIGGFLGGNGKYGKD